MSSLASSTSPAEIVARAAKKAYDASQLLDVAERQSALTAVKKALAEAKDEILAANALDLKVRRRFPFADSFARADERQPTCTGCARASDGWNDVVFAVETIRFIIFRR